MNIAIHASGQIGTQGRGIGVYTKLLFDALCEISKDEHFTVALKEKVTRYA